MASIPRLRVLAAVCTVVFTFSLFHTASAKAPTPPALLAAPTVSTYVLHGTFTTTNQNQLGPGAPTQTDFTENLFDVGWGPLSASVGGIAHVDVDPCDPIPGVSCGVSGDFGAQITASTSGRMAMSTTYHNVT